MEYDKAQTLILINRSIFVLKRILNISERQEFLFELSTRYNTIYLTKKVSYRKYRIKINEN